MVRVRPPKPQVRAPRSLPASGGVMNPWPNHSPSAPPAIQTTPTRPAPASHLAAAAHRLSSRPRSETVARCLFLMPGRPISRAIGIRASAPRRSERVPRPAPSKEYNPHRSVAEQKAKPAVQKGSKMASGTKTKKNKK